MEPDRPTTNPVVASATRGDLIEARHRGAACVVNHHGDVLCAFGDVRQPSYMRSALKFIQVLPLIESGAAEKFGIDDEEIAVMCASHSSEPQHIAVVERILDKIGLTADFLKCGTHVPISQPAFEELLRQGETLNAIHNNCSGKHAGFLALASHLG